MIDDFDIKGCYSFCGFLLVDNSVVTAVYVSTFNFLGFVPRYEVLQVPVSRNLCVGGGHVIYINTFSEFNHLNDTVTNVVFQYKSYLSFFRPKIKPYVLCNHVRDSVPREIQLRKYYLIKEGDVVLPTKNVYVAKIDTKI
jgi:hypothetical protein